VLWPGSGVAAEGVGDAELVPPCGDVPADGASAGPERAGPVVTLPPNVPWAIAAADMARCVMCARVGSRPDDDPAATTGPSENRAPHAQVKPRASARDRLRRAA